MSFRNAMTMPNTDTRGVQVAHMIHCSLTPWNQPIGKLILIFIQILCMTRHIEVDDADQFQKKFCGISTHDKRNLKLHFIHIPF